MATFFPSPSPHALDLSDTRCCFFHMKRKALAIIAVGILAAAAEGASDPAELRVAVAVEPWTALVQELGGEAVQVHCVHDSGSSCALFEARPTTIRFLESADLFVRTGVGYERSLLGNGSGPGENALVVDVRDAVELIPFRQGHVHDHDHDHDHEPHRNHAAQMDPHTWMDPRRVAGQIGLVAEALAGLRPANAEEVRRRSATLRERILRLDSDLAQLLEPYSGRAFYIYHPAMGYFADRYNLRQVALAGPVRAPSMQQLRSHMREARKQGIRTIFVQPEESRRHADILAEAIGAEVVEIDPLAPDWEAEMRRIGQKLARAFAREEGA